MAKLIKRLMIYVVLPVSLLCFAIVEWERDRIWIGMSLSRAESILGPSRKIEPSNLPHTPNGPVLSGDEIRTWGQIGDHPRTNRWYFVSVHDGKIIDVYIFRHSF